jgi:hypothetical protein
MACSFPYSLSVAKGMGEGRVRGWGVSESLRIIEEKPSPGVP